MKLPGFTARASLYNESEHFRTIWIHGVNRHDDKVLPNFYIPGGWGGVGGTVVLICHCPSHGLCNCAPVDIQ
jgi:hypothetical protein